MTELNDQVVAEFRANAPTRRPTRTSDDRAQ
jgi:hypothetical protein